MKILLTGAAGFIGQQLIERFASEKHEVFVLDRQPVKAEGVTYVQADITDTAQLQTAQKQVGELDSIIHLAAAVPKTKEDDDAETMWQVNVGGTIKLLDVFAPHIKNFVYASTAEVYGLPDVSGKIDENLTPQPLSYYGAAKLSGELFARVFGQRHNLPITILRFTVMYGPGDTIKRAVPNFIDKALSGENLEVFGGEELRDYIYLDDVSEALYLAALKGVNGTFNIGTGQGIAVKDVAQLIIKKVNPKLSATILPREKKASDIVLDCSLAGKELGFKARYHFPDQLEKQIEWQRSRQ